MSEPKQDEYRQEYFRPERVAARAQRRERDRAAFALLTLELAREALGDVG